MCAKTVVCCGFVKLVLFRIFLRVSILLHPLKECPHTKPFSFHNKRPLVQNGLLSSTAK